MNIRAILNQTKLPKLWTFAQIAIGGAIDKRKLCTLKLGQAKSVLEVGCSTGIMTKAFLNFKDFSYVGLDIDPAVIAVARRFYTSHSNIQFVCEDLFAFSKRGNTFDCVLFAGVLHHVDDEMAKKMLAEATRIINPGGHILIVEPMIPETKDPRFFSFYLLIEEGLHVRKGEHFIKLIKGVPELVIIEEEYHYTGATPLSLPKCARFGVYVLKKSTSS